MNRNQRRLGRMHQKRINEHESRRETHDRKIKVEIERGNKHERINSKHDKPERLERNRERVENVDADENANSTQLNEVLSPRVRNVPQRLDKFTTNKCCYVAPKQEDFGQLTDAKSAEPPFDKYQNILKEQFGFDPLIPETVDQLKELKKVLCDRVPKVENSSQYASDKKLSVPEFAETIDGSQWQNIDNTDEIDKYLCQEKEKLGSCLYLPENVHICEIPRIKIIAKKFSRYKKNNVELRKLDEKVVCVEYDVCLGDSVKPAEKLRAFFSIKPTNVSEENDQIPTKIKNTFDISDVDLKKLNEKEIEIIDGKITENKTYLEDLKRILRRKQAIQNKKNKNSLDLLSLYEMAKRDSPPLDDQFSNTNFLSKAELQEMKDLILRKCASSAQGISRRTVKTNPEAEIGMDVISQSIMTELLRESSINE